MESERFNHYFLFLDVRRDFVVWHAVNEKPGSYASLDDIRRHELMLAGLDHLSEEMH
ncbi:Negative regulator of hrp expression HrpV [Pseudomonas syringae]|nr:Negative regulator of hrp expression HrpV [Pseudomonas syringae]RMV32842.1 Negative regulator of hrp expression HrpV [Pseudomonas syringae pv. maculicola]